MRDGLAAVEAWAQAHGRLIVGVWLAGALAAALNLGTRLAVLARVRRGCRALSDPLPGSVTNAHSASVRRARLLESDDLAASAVLGLARPIIALPAGYAASAHPDDLRFVLAHEAAHIVRWDDWIDLSARLVEAAFWFNPLLPLAADARRWNASAPATRSPP